MDRLNSFGMQSMQSMRYSSPPPTTTMETSCTMFHTTWSGYAQNKKRQNMSTLALIVLTMQSMKVFHPLGCCLTPIKQSINGCGHPFVMSSRTDQEHLDLEEEPFPPFLRNGNLPKCQVWLKYLSNPSTRILFVIRVLLYFIIGGGLLSFQQGSFFKG